MSKEKIKNNVKPVGVGVPNDPHFKELTKQKRELVGVHNCTRENNGITLVALIITIIVMLILVGISVTVALNGGIFTKAKNAGNRTAQEMEKELEVLEGPFEIDGKKYDSFDDYLNNKGIIDLPQGWAIVETKPEGWSENVTAVTDGTNTIPLPNRFELSKKETEDEISEGLVLKDGANEFVWIPVTNAESYEEDSFGPLTNTDSTSKYTYDSQEELNYYYGMQEDGTTPYYNYADFTYAIDKKNAEESIQTYGGFYVGRYETTINATTIGVEQGKTILTCATLLKEGINTTSNDEYHYRWWGLYKAQKDMYANNLSVGSLMISGKQWSAIMAFTKDTTAKRDTDTYTNINEADLSGSSYKTESTKYDVSKNIYDLAGNVSETTISLFENERRSNRGGFYKSGQFKASYSGGRYQNESDNTFRF